MIVNRKSKIKTNFLLFHAAILPQQLQLDQSQFKTSININSFVSVGIMHLSQISFKFEGTEGICAELNLMNLLTEFVTATCTI